MLLQIRRTGEAFPALRALVRLDTRVNSLVPNKVGGLVSSTHLSEGHLTVFIAAKEGFLFVLF